MSAPPLLVCLDLQQGFLDAAGLSTPAGAEALVECGRILAQARRRRWSVAHCFVRGGALNMAGAAALPIHGFSPRSNEAVFERASLSAYGHPTFADLIDRAPRRCALIAGLSASYTFLATAFDAYERGHRLVVAADAFAAQPGPSASAEHHKAVAGDIAQRLGFALAPAGAAGLEIEAIVGPRSWEGARRE